MSKVIIPKLIFVFLIYPLVLLTTLLIVFSAPVSAATEFTCMVDPDNGSGTDYTSLSDWEAAINTDLVSSSTKVYSVSTASSTGTTTDGAIVTGSVSTTTKATVKHYTNTTHQILVENIRKVLTGTLTFSTSSSDVTGSGTDFTNELQAGDHIWLESAQTWQEVASISSSTLLTLTAISTISGTGQASRKLRDGGTDSAFQANEKLQVDANNYVTITNNGDSAIAVASCRSTNGSYDESMVTIDGWVTSATNYIKIWTDPDDPYGRHDGTVNGGGYTMKSTSSAAYVYNIYIKEPYTIIDGIKIERTSDNWESGEAIRMVESSASLSTIKNCLLIQSSGTDHDALLEISRSAWDSYGIKIYNNILVSDSNALARGIYIRDDYSHVMGADGEQKIYNNTIYGEFTTAGIDIDVTHTTGDNYKPLVKNNYVVNIGSGVDFKLDNQYNNTLANFAYNASDDTTAGTSNNNQQIATTNLFVSTTGGAENLHLQSSAGLVDAGTDLSGAFTDDIDGETRSGVWDIGADEVFSISFDSTSSSGLESSTSVSLPIELSSSYSSDITVNYTLTGAATGSGTDYTDLGSGSVTISAGQTTTSIPLTIVDDNIDENNETIITTLSSVSSGLLGNTTTYTYTILDNDTAGITITPTSDLTTTEAGGTDTFTIVLTSQPTSNVVINLSSSDTGEGTVSPSSITLTSSNWNTPQTITVSGVDDYLLDGNIAYTINISNSISSDSNYNGLVPNVSSLSALNTDDDVAGSGLPVAALTPPTPPAPSPENPQGGFRIIINNNNNNNNSNINNNNGDKTTNSQLVTLTLAAGPDTQKMAISNYSDFRESIQIPYQSKYQWQLLPGSGTKTVYAKFYTQYGQPSTVVSDTIELEYNGSCNQQDGDLIRNPNANGMAKNGMAKYDVYIVKIVGDKKYKRLIINPKVFNSYGSLFDHNRNNNPWDDIKLVNQSTMDQFKTSTLVRYSDPSVGINDPKVYQLSPNGDQGTKTWLNLTPQQFEADGYDWDEIFIINQVERELYKS